MTTEPDDSAILRCLRERDRFLLTGHVRADGDCLGAQVALYHLLKALGKKVNIINPDPIADRYQFMTKDTPIGHWDTTKSDGGVGAFDVACLLDCAILERTGPMADRIRREKATICVVDHHQPSGAVPFDVEWIDPTAPASGVLVYRLAKKLGIELPRCALDAVFISLTTDTGWFKYSNTDRETLQSAADLVGAGVQPAAIFEKLYQQFPPEYPIGIGAALGTLRYEANGRLAVVMVRREELRKLNADLAETDDVLDILRSVSRVDVVLLFREPQLGRIKCSARSKGSLDVNALMKNFGGGGHMKAAGADLEGSMDAVVDRVVKAAVHTINAASK